MVGGVRGGRSGRGRRGGAGGRPEGHLFVVRADLRHLDCDAWLLPTDEVFRVEEPWCREVGLARPRRLRQPRWERGERVRRWDRPHGDEEGDRDRPHIWLGDVGVADGTPVGEAVARAAGVATAFVAAARDTPHPDRRPLPRLALPLIGTGAGGLADAPGDLLRPLVATLRQAAADHGVDVVLSVVDDLAWSAVQHVRRSTPPAAWPLPPGLVAVAQDLAAHARRGHLVLFLGAGASMDAGLPGWDELLDGAAAGAGFGREEWARYRGLPPEDRATLVEQRAGSHERLVGLLADGLRAERFGLTHALLASLRSESTVTTNFDDLVERAMTLPGADGPVTLPYEPGGPGLPWVLKLHGDLRRGDPIITRQDYLRAERTRSALVGIVQAMLVTRHLVFVGYSLSEADVHRLVDEIRSVMGDSAPDHLGTVLLVDDPPTRPLWDSVLQLHTPDATASAVENGRSLQVLLDLVNHLATTPAQHLLDDRYRGLLDDCEECLASALRRPAGIADACAEEGSEVARQVARVLSALGHAPEPCREPPSRAERLAAQCWPDDTVPGDRATTAFRRWARLHQARWREARGLPMGSQPMRPTAARPGRPLGSRLEVDHAWSHRDNLLCDASRRAVDHRLANPQPRQTLHADRLIADLLSSMTMCFNLFGSVWDDLRLADEAARAWFPGWSGRVTGVGFEGGPNPTFRGDPAHLGDGTAFDAWITLSLANGTSGIIGIETKYHEWAQPEAPPGPARLERYLEVAERSGVFRPDAVERILGTGLQQIWRDHLLVLSMLQQPGAGWTWGRYVLVHPAGNASFARAVERYRCLLADGSTFQSVTLEELLRPGGPLPESCRAALVERYLCRRDCDGCRAGAGQGGR